MSEGAHPIFRTDPAKWMSYVGKEVCVTIETGETHTGRVYTVDPVSQSVVLARFHGDSDDKVTVKVVLGHVVQSVVVLDDNRGQHQAEMDAFFKPRELRETASPEELRNKRDRLRDWLLKNRLPVSVVGDNSELLSVCDALTVEPPYSAENCRSVNQIILGRIQGLIANMPKDVDEW